eukprot:CAMPEP_0197911784 /NCGR_PEP_ID=MMETSP1439-20131203/73514_1 /TAXON_ID=66791 /ORGANISM="Gonyaulax spinifera, Strain CCMP409" /LENGTH=86 /DNA_ID=CAMNT_0043533537 /DNA_START=83 /DNA_END=339 /DNA_ORIENTATION=-
MPRASAPCRRPALLACGLPLLPEQRATPVERRGTAGHKRREQTCAPARCAALGPGGPQAAGRGGAGGSGRLQPSSDKRAHSRWGLT